MIAPDVALERAQALCCQLKYDRVLFQCDEYTDHEPVIVISRVPIYCYNLPPNDPKFGEGAVAIPLTGLTLEFFENRILQALVALDEGLDKNYPGEAKARAAMIRKIAN